jgi:hypothetical protein
MKQASGTDGAPKMKKRFKRKWVEALRSGEYEQASGFLKVGDGYCCLGVLRDLINPRSRAADSEWSVLCARHAALVGLPKFDSDDPESPQKVLIDMNDNGDSFVDIADWIEANL